MELDTCELIDFADLAELMTESAGKGLVGVAKRDSERPSTPRHEHLVQVKLGTGYSRCILANT